MDSEFVRLVRQIADAARNVPPVGFCELERRFFATARASKARFSVMTTEGVKTEIIELTKLAAPRREPTKCVPQRRAPLGGPTNDTQARTTALEPTSGAHARGALEPTSGAHARGALEPTNGAHARGALEPTNGTPARIAAHEPTSATPACGAAVESANDASRARAAFGEFLVENRVLDRYQLFRVLQLQDRMPGVRLGHCAVALGYAPRTEIEQLHVRFVQSDEAQIEDIDLESMTTDAFERDPEIDIQYRDVPR